MPKLLVDLVGREEVHQLKVRVHRRNEHSVEGRCSFLVRHKPRVGADLKIDFEDGGSQANVHSITCVPDGDGFVVEGRIEGQVPAAFEVDQ